MKNAARTFELCPSSFSLSSLISSFNLFTCDASSFLIALTYRENIDK